MALRICFVILLLLSILFMPLWLSILIALAGMVFNSNFWEAAVLFLLSDILYGVKETKFYGMVFVSFFISLAILIVIELFKKKLKFYS